MRSCTAAPAGPPNVGSRNVAQAMPARIAPTASSTRIALVNRFMLAPVGGQPTWYFAAQKSPLLVRGSGPMALDRGSMTARVVRSAVENVRHAVVVEVAPLRMAVGGARVVE